MSHLSRKPGDSLSVARRFETDKQFLRILERPLDGDIQLDPRQIESIRMFFKKQIKSRIGCLVIIFLNTNPPIVQNRGKDSYSSLFK